MLGYNILTHVGCMFSSYELQKININIWGLGHGGLKILIGYLSKLKYF